MRANVGAGVLVGVGVGVQAKYSVNLSAKIENYRRVQDYAIA